LKSLPAKDTPRNIRWIENCDTPLMHVEEVVEQQE